ncbi:hypothetical protein PINS_up000783 [Pythium insidiosum]|nr:hypothetical protein PINS_up000783 [Pythium insidiosum]
MLSPMQVGDAMLGQFCEAVVFVVDHVMPKVSKYWLHWDSDNEDLGPIIPEFGTEVHHDATKVTTATTRPAVVA